MTDPLDNILRLKTWKKEELEMEIGRLEESLQREREGLRRLESEFARRVEEFSRKEGFGPDSLRMFHLYMARVNREMKEQRGMILKRVKDLETTRERLVEAYKEKVLIEKLRQRRMAMGTEREERLRQKELDFICLQRYRR